MQLLMIFVHVLEAYFDYLISAFLNIRYPLYNPTGELVGLAFGYVSFFFTFIMMPIYLLYTLAKPIAYFREP